ncbi:MAG: nuclear transport factor 2 family protein [Halopenitus sp.]
MNAEDLARAYYDAIDAGDYDRLAAILDPEFTHYRPDRTLDGRGEFVRFMRDERPMTDTDHEVDGVYSKGDEVAVQGRLLDSAGAELFRFVDLFTVEEGTLASLDTYSE